MGGNCALALCAALWAGAPAQEAAAPARPRLERLAVLATAAPGAEIVSVQASTKRALLTHSQAGAVELFDLADPARPRALRLFDLDLGKGEELTSVALPPGGAWFLAAVKAKDQLAPGRIIACSLDDGRRLAVFPCGVGPDCIALDRAGCHALVACEAEGFELAEGEPRSAPGSLTWIELASEIERSSVRQIALADAPGLDDPAGRLLERKIRGEWTFVPLRTTAEFLEPECVAFDPAGKTAYVTLQEVNAVAVLDVGVAAVTAVRPLGLITHPADLLEGGAFEEQATLVARREPDGIAVSPDGRLLVTADEGDTFPKAVETPKNVPAAGGRSVSVFDARTLELLGDTGSQLDRAAAAAGLYPDQRSGEKGCEPEMVVAFELGGSPCAAVTLERAGALALIDLRDPARPLVVALAAVGKNPPLDEPEGLAHYRDPVTLRDYVYTANEGTGTLGVILVRP